MGQIIFSRHPTGTIGIGLVVAVISAFLLSTLDPLFGPLAVACIAAGSVGAGLLARRHKNVVLHVDPRDPSNSDETPPPIVPR